MVVLPSIKCKYIYIHSGKRLTFRVFSYQLGGGSLSVGGVVLRSDALARALISLKTFSSLSASLSMIETLSCFETFAIVT